MAAIISRNIFDDTGLARSRTAIRCDNGSGGHLIESNIIEGTDRHAIWLNGVSGVVVQNNQIGAAGQGTANTYDAIFLEANVDSCLIQDNRVRADGGARYGINVAASTCDNNVIVGNDLGGTADYGTDALNDSGTGTILSYPGDATYGDNFVS